MTYSHRLRLPLAVAIIFSIVAGAQNIARPDPTDPAHPFDTPGPVAHPASSAQFSEWRQQALAALFLAGTKPPLAPRDFGTFQAMPGVVAHRVTYGTQFGMRVPAIVYRPEHAQGKLPAVIVVAGHGGDKSTWYEVYAGLLYASAGAVVVTFDPIGEGERNAEHLHDARAHDTVLPGATSPARLGGLMIGDVSQAVSYSLSLPEVDPDRVAVLGYSMGSFHAALAAGLDPRIHFLVLSGGGDLDGNGGSWDSSSKIMCQGGPYQALSFLPDKGAVLYALHQRAGETLVLNGVEDNLVAAPHHGPSFFADLNARVAALTGGARPPIETRFYPGVGHRPSWVNRDAAAWLNARLVFPNWRGQSIDSLGETHIGAWATATGARINHGYETEKTEAGVQAVGLNFPAPAAAQLAALPEAEWSAHQDLYTWQGWAQRTLQAEGVSDPVPTPAKSR
jgi:dienelactone hydrolase